MEDIAKGLLDLFCTELEAQVTVLNDGVVALEEGRETSLEALMRAAHSIKGSARLVGLTPFVPLAHALEDYFVAIQNKKITFQEGHADYLFHAIDEIAKIKEVPQETIPSYLKDKTSELRQIGEQITALTKGDVPQYIKAEQPAAGKKEDISERDRVLRVTAQNLNRLMGLAGESMVESRWLQPFSDQLLKIKKELRSITTEAELVFDQFKENKMGDLLHPIIDKNAQCFNSLSHRIGDLDLFISRHSSLTDRLYSEVIQSRMRPFSDGTEGFPRMVRDLAKQLGKKVHLEIEGQNTPIDRDILDKLEAPLSHLLRNAVDHGIESPEERVAQGKPAEGTIKLTAHHRAGMLIITVSDDGRGVNLEILKNTIIQSNLAKGDLAKNLTKQELLDFLFLPGFSTSKIVSDISGRGMGLNIVQNMLQEVSGSIHINTEYGKGIEFCLSLPLTLSVIRALTVEVAGEPYAFPLSRIECALLVPMEQIEVIENRQYFNYLEQNIGLVPASQILELSPEEPEHKVLPVIVLREHNNVYGLVVDSFLGERELVLQDIETKLGKVPDISSGAFMEDGTPLLIIDVDDIISSIDSLLSGGRLQLLQYKEQKTIESKAKRILIVDDSITVREVESRLLRNHGYQVETAVNGMDAWNAVRMSSYDLIITDIDMPRMNGIELVQMIRNETRLKNLPVMIVSYKDREQDRIRGMEVGANYYMTKSSFHDETLLQAVEELIGKA